MATVTTTLAWPTGIDGTELTSWAGDASFATSPVAGDLIAGPDTLTVGVDGTVTGADGTYILTHILADGSAQSISYVIGVPADTTAPILTNAAATVVSDTELSATVDTDEDNATLFYLATTNATELQADVISLGESQAVSAVGTQSVSTTGLTAETGYRVHFVQQDTAGNNSAVVTSPLVTTDAAPVPVDVTVTTTLALPLGYQSVIVGASPDYTVFSNNGWTAGDYPQTGEVLVWDNTDITFASDLTVTGNTESANIYCAVIRLNGAADGFTLDASQIPEVQVTDTTPTQFTFTDLVGQPTSTQRESSAITISGVDPATDIPASITGGEYIVSTNGGGTWSAPSSANTNLRHTDQVKLVATTNASTSTATNVAFTAGGISDTWTLTTVAATQAPQGTITFGTATIDGDSISQTFSYDQFDETSFEYRIDGGAIQTATSPLTAETLANSQTVTFEVRAVNPIGNGPWFTVQRTTDAAPGSVPQGTITFGTPTITGDSITQPFTYSAGDQTGFQYRIDGGTIQAATSPVVVSSLAYSQAVQISVRAVNATGSGSWLNVTRTTTAEPIDLPDYQLVRGASIVLTTTLATLAPGQFYLAYAVVDGTRHYLEVTAYSAGNVTVTVPAGFPLVAVEGSQTLTVERARLAA